MRAEVEESERPSSRWSSHSVSEAWADGYDIKILTERIDCQPCLLKVSHDPVPLLQLKALLPSFFLQLTASLPSFCAGCLGRPFFRQGRSIHAHPLERRLLRRLRVVVLDLLEGGLHVRKVAGSATGIEQQACHGSFLGRVCEEAQNGHRSWQANHCRL